MAKKILFNLQRQGIVEKIGKSPATKYRFIKQKTPVPPPSRCDAWSHG
ncbi:MAG: hypothetical protein WBI82_17150 [Sphaerochaeta sp.]